MHLRKDGSESLVLPTNQELAEIERAGKKKAKMNNNNNLGGGNNEPADVNAAMAEMRRMAEENARLHREMREMRDAQNQRPTAIGATDTPHSFYTKRAAICAERIPGQNNEITPQMITLVKQMQYHGMAHENPMDHVDDYERLCNTITNGTPSDYSMCMLFHFSLIDKADKWLKALPPASLTTWAEIRASFLDHFFNKSKTVALRNKITNFQQVTNESFCDAWQRFKEYKRECPHHGYTEPQLLNIFYDGVNWDYKNALNSASNGDFMTQSEAGAIKLIENLAASSYNRSMEHDRSRRVNGIESEDVKGIKDDIRELKDFIFKSNATKTVHFADVDAVQDEDEEVAYVGNYGGRYNNNNRPYSNKPSSGGWQKPIGEARNHGNSSYQSPKKPDDETKSMLEQILEGQQNMQVSFNGKIDDVYTNLSGRIDQLTAHLKKTDLQVAQTAEAVRRQEGFLPGKTSTNPKQNCSAVTTRSGKKLVEHPKHVQEPEDLEWEVNDENLLENEADPSGTGECRSTHHWCRSTPLGNSNFCFAG